MFYYLFHHSKFTTYSTVLESSLFRFSAALIMSLLLMLVFGSWGIRVLKKWQVHGQPIREVGIQSHLIEKKGTPTMGGLLILSSLFLSTLFWADLSNKFIWIVLFVTFCFGLIGFVDDYLKVKSNNNLSGVPGRLRLLCGAVVSLAMLLVMVNFLGKDMMSGVSMPFFHDLLIDYGLWLFLPFGVFVIVGSANAVNLTDGLDGLAIVPCILVASCFALLSYLVGDSIFSEYFHISYMSGMSELSIFCGALIGSGLGFLRFNFHPAKIFMGDTGSLALGASFGCMAIMTKHEMFLAIIGGLFVIETLSVVLQVYCFKLTGKRIFAMAPLHHHFEKHGWSERKIVYCFWFVAIIFALIGLASINFTIGSS